MRDGGTPHTTDWHALLLNEGVASDARGGDHVAQSLAARRASGPSGPHAKSQRATGPVRLDELIEIRLYPLSLLLGQPINVQRADEMVELVLPRVRTRHVSESRTRRHV